VVVSGRRNSVGIFAVAVVLSLLYHCGHQVTGSPPLDNVTVVVVTAIVVFAQFAVVVVVVVALWTLVRPIAFELRELGIKTKLLHDARVLARHQVQVVFRLGTGHDHLP
jgi:hypothetical protein